MSCPNIRIGWDGNGYDQRFDSVNLICYFNLWGNFRGDWASATEFCSENSFANDSQLPVFYTYAEFQGFQNVMVYVDGSQIYIEIIIVLIKTIYGVGKHFSNVVGFNKSKQFSIRLGMVQWN